MLGYSQLFAREQVLNLLDGVGFELVASVSSLTEAGLVPGPECLVMMARCRLGHRR
jgi:hypothetical protein